MVYTVICVNTFAQSSLGKTKFSKIEVSSGLSNSNITCILQDSKGFMWFGTEDGLNKYDGYDFTVYRNNLEDTISSLRTNSIYCVFEDSNKKLWVSTRGGGVHYYDSKLDRFIRLSEFSANCEINTIFEDKKKNIWLAGKREKYAFIAVLKRGESKWQMHNVFETREAVSSIQQDSENEFWLGIRRAGLFKWNAQNNTILESYMSDKKDKNTLIGNDVRRVLKVDHYLWVATSDGLSKLDLQTRSFQNFARSATNKNAPLINTVSDIIVNGNFLWLSTQNGGISRLDIKTNNFTNFAFDKNDPYSLSDNSVWTIYKDKQDRIWCGTFSKGICFIDNQHEKFSELNVPLENDVVNAIWKDEHDRIWIGTEGGIVRKDGDRLKTYQHDPLKKGSISSDPILSIYQDSKKRMWFGTWAGGLNRYDEASDKFINYTTNPENPQGLSDPNVYSIIEDAKTHQLMVSSYRGLNILTDEKKGVFRHYIDIATHEGNNYIKALYQDKDRKLWIGSLGELNYFDLDNNIRKRYYIGSNGDSTTIGEIYWMHEDRKGRFWIGAVNGLHQKFSDNTFKSYTIKDGLPINIVNGILEDSRSNLWLSTTKGISMFNPETEKFINYDVSDGLVSNEFKPNACFKDANGQFFFGGKRVVVFHPDSIRKNPAIPPVFLTALKVLNETVKINGLDKILKENISESTHIVIPYQYHFFTINYVALNFTSTNKNQYAYKLYGFDNEWNYVGGQRYATYTNLDPGTYTFKVKASNNDGLWNEEGASILITIQPPWWNTLLFKILLGATIIGASVGYYRFRVKAISNQNKRLAFLVKERTIELEKSNSELLIREQEIGIQNKMLVEHQEELASQNEELIQSQEEISAQRDLVADQNKKLQDARNTIEEQNLKIKIRNEDLELEVEKRTKELVAYNQQLEQFAFITAHNLRAPVARILGLGQVLELSQHTKQDENIIYDKLIYTTQELDRVVKDLNTILDVRNNNSLVLTDVNLAEELKVIRVILEKEIMETTAEIECDFSSVKSIRTAKPYLESILINLISNAIKYRREGRKPVIKIETSLVDEYICLSVNDNGLGLDLSLYRTKLFNLYSRFHTHVEGKGMGLYLVKTQIDSLGGKIEVESEVDNGVMFKLYFKLNPVDNAGSDDLNTHL